MRRNLGRQANDEHDGETVPAAALPRRGQTVAPAGLLDDTCRRGIVLGSAYALGEEHPPALLAFSPSLGGGLLFTHTLPAERTRVGCRDNPFVVHPKRPAWWFRWRSG